MIFTPKIYAVLSDQLIFPTKKPYRLSASFLKISKVFVFEVFFYSVSDTLNVAKSLPTLKQIYLKPA